MSFREKSAWIMSVALSLAGVFYFLAVATSGSEPGRLAEPGLPLVIVYTVCLVLLAIVGHIVIAALAPREANAPTDERERQIFYRAGHYSSIVFAIGVMLSLGLYLVSRDGNQLFYAVFASLMLGQIAEYVLQVFFYRTVV